ncbi:MAG: putative lipid II flippase FtsW [Candidatus Omnitrophota bacterium]
MRDLRISIAIMVSMLVCIGVVMIFSASGVYALQEEGDSGYFLKRHLVFVMIGLVSAVIMMSFDYRELQKYAKPLLLMALALLVLVLIPGIGREIHGARRWFRIGSFSFQPSEFTKLVMIIYAADYLARKRNKIRDLTQGFMPLMGVLGVVCLLILKQPDLGTSLSIAFILLIMFFVAGTNLAHLGLVCLLAIPAITLLIARVPYRLRRILAFLDPWQDSQGIGFQLTQSQIALGSGGLLGVGLGKSLQKLFYLPAAHTDFIFSIIGEELGLLGTMTIILLFVFLIWQGARIAKRTQDPFGYYLSVGIVAMIGLQAVVNIGVSIGALPTKGLPLPFVSYGGSALIVNITAIGLLLNISRIEEL